MNATLRNQTPLVPTQQEVQQATNAIPTLLAYLKNNPLEADAVAEVKFADRDRASDTISIPGVVLNMVADILTQMAQGHVVTLIPSQRMLTTQEAANILNVSRPHLVKLLAAGEIRHSLVGRHRRIQFEDLIKYQESVLRSGDDAVRELTAEAQELGLGY